MGLSSIAFCLKNGETVWLEDDGFSPFDEEKILANKIRGLSRAKDLEDVRVCLGKCFYDEDYFVPDEWEEFVVDEIGESGLDAVASIEVYAGWYNDEGELIESNLEYSF